MQEVPELWRTELWHPLTVHLPMALLMLSAICYIVFLLAKSRGGNWLFTYRVLLFTGVAGAWLAIYTGDLADGIVSRQICDPTVLKDHENFSYAVAIMFSVAAAIQMIPVLGKFPPAFNKTTRILSLVLLLAGSGLLAYTGHLGATLVYQQGAGVYHPSEDCKEFE